MRDLHNNIDVKQALETIVVNNDTEGTGATVDLQGYDACELIVDVGESGDTLSGSFSLDLVLQLGDLDERLRPRPRSRQADALGTMAPTGIFATVDADGEDGAIYRVGYCGPKRYVRLFVDTTGTHTNGTPLGGRRGPRPRAPQRRPGRLARS